MQIRTICSVKIFAKKKWIHKPIFTGRKLYKQSQLEPEKLHTS